MLQLLVSFPEELRQWKHLLDKQRLLSLLQLLLRRYLFLYQPDCVFSEFLLNVQLLLELIQHVQTNLLLRCQ